MIENADLWAVIVLTGIGLMVLFLAFILIELVKLRIAIEEQQLEDKQDERADRRADSGERLPYGAWRGGL